MKPLKTTRALPEIRVTRRTNHDVAHADGHGWAVSYADLLMVLLSFFVIYFNMNENTSESVQNQLQRLSMEMKGMKTEEIDRVLRKPDSVGVSQLAETLRLDGMKVAQVGDVLFVEMAGGAFSSAEYHVSPGLRGQVDRVFEHLKPFSGKIALTVVGHADGRPLIRRNEFLTDNFDLSSLRALRVMKYLVGKGFPENHASARAASSFDREARSITLEIRLASGKASEET